MLVTARATAVQRQGKNRQSPGEKSLLLCTCGTEKDA